MTLGRNLSMVRRAPNTAMASSPPAIVIAKSRPPQFVLGFDSIGGITTPQSAWVSRGHSGARLG
jgi:hypothetical protein